LTRFRRIAAFGALLALVCLLPAPARGAVLADFNNDGIADRVQISSSSDRRLVVRVSGSVPQVLRLRDRLIAIVAVDIDHDGNLDLGALSERHGLLIWLNGGGHGRFKALKKKRVAHGVRFPAEASLLATESHDDRPVAQYGRPPDGDPAVRAVRGTAIVVPPTRAFTLTPFCPRTARGRAALSAPRAPPSLV
jgi:hypothetical protein